jgi:hypothetical protein
MLSALAGAIGFGGGNNDNDNDGIAAAQPAQGYDSDEEIELEIVCDEMPGDDVVVDRRTCGFWVMNAFDETFEVKLDDADVILFGDANNAHTYYIGVYSGDNVVCCQLVDSFMQLQFDAANNSIVWIRYVS